MSEQHIEYLGTANRGFAQQAQEEIRRLFGQQVKCKWVVPNEVFSFELGLSREEAAGKLREQEPAFLRHIQPIDRLVAWEGTTEEAVRELQSYLAEDAERIAGSTIAVQLRKGEGSALPAFSMPELKSAAEELLTREHHAEPVARGARLVLSVLATDAALYLGLSRPEDNLSDWAGGAVRFRREEGQISRAKFKLLEAEVTFGLELSAYRSALDVGAAPGGWTSLLLERGLEVTAVDPAKLDASLLKHPRLTYLSKKADQVQFDEGHFDLLVCDMSWSHRQMARLVNGLLYSLQSGGTVIITVKLMHKKAFQTIREVVEDLSAQLDLQQAKQLFHNREELTLFFIKK
ncbi:MULTISPECIES: SAM-dependent methyltransferase [Paenibacillus]|uniref:SAM-dependent methyltransferase n=1 Tax=Paenibacillus TaxID=44249 RepID=UPI0022B875CC|nr:SAM-dependent methyltransferase [Paenibacillus caseinilyticus]MCZ8521506.1 methyltransferase domain-containing protein [Paenibacillus caseinilyticus]